MYQSRNQTGNVFKSVSKKAHKDNQLITEIEDIEQAAEILLKALY